MIGRARTEGRPRIRTFAFAGGVSPHSDLSDVRRLRAAIGRADVVPVHRGKGDWLAAAAHPLGPTSWPVIRTRHIMRAVRPHAGNRWLQRRATALLVAVTGSIWTQYIASGLLATEQMVALPGGVDVEAYRPCPATPDLRGRLGATPQAPLVGMVSDLRVIKGDRVVIDAATRRTAQGIRPQFTFIGEGSQETAICEAVERARLDAQVTIAGFVDDLPAPMATLDVALYVRQRRTTSRSSIIPSSR